MSRSSRAPEHPKSLSDIVQRLAALGLTLPKPAAPVAAYVPAVFADNLLYISGQLPLRDGAVVTGRLGGDIDTATGYDAARRCGLMLIAQIGAALDGDFSRVARIVKLGIFVSSTPDFTAQPQVGDGASDLMESVFGKIGCHSRSAVGVPVLPYGAAVEIDAVIALRSA